MSSLSASNNLATITQFLQGKGLSNAAIAGIEGNFQVESGFDPSAYNAGENAIGLAQWEGGRRTALDSYAAQTHGSETSLMTQLGYFWQELSTSYAGVLSSIKRSNDPGANAATVDAQYEVSSGSARQQRIANAQTIYAQLASGAIPSASLPVNPNNVNGGSTIAAADGSTIAAGVGIPGVPGSSFWSEILPWNWGKDISNAGKGIVGAIIPFVLKLAFVGGGITLVLFGAWRASGPARDKANEANQAAGQLAPLAAVA